MSKEIYHKHKQPPEWALKEIKGGRLKGKTDINPQWRYEVLNDTFGLIGVGWNYRVTKQWLEDGANGEVCAFVNIDLFVKIDSEWSDAIPGNGGSSFVAKEVNGLRTNDECFKMATTDALSVACKMLGIGAAVYSGTKYTQANEHIPEKGFIIDMIANCGNMEEFKKVGKYIRKSNLINEYTEILNKKYNEIKDNYESK